MPEFEIQTTSKSVGDILRSGEGSYDKSAALKQILGMIDLTTLSGDDTEAGVTDLCTRGMSYFNGEKGIPNVAAICVYPVFAHLVRQVLKGTDVRTACVAGAFPSGHSSLTLRR